MSRIHAVSPRSDAERIREIQRVYEEILSYGLWPNTTTHNSVMSAHMEYGYVDDAVQHFYDMQEMGAIPDEVTASAAADSAYRLMQ